MDKELTKDEVAQQARELAQRVMAKSAQPQEWPKKPTKAGSNASKPPAGLVFVVKDRIGQIDGHGSIVLPTNANLQG